MRFFNEADLFCWYALNDFVMQFDVVPDHNHAGDMT